jgi:hypothetical protein
MRRRTLLATAATSLPAVVAGCNSRGESTGSYGTVELPTVRFELTTKSDPELPTEVLYTVRPDDGDGTTAELFDQILDGGTTTQETRPPLPDQQHIAYKEGVYELTRELIKETPATRYSVRVDVVTDSVTETEAILFGDLPEVDKNKFAERGLADGDPVGVGTGFLYTDAEREQSVLVSDSEYSYITWDDGTEAVWAVDNATETTLNTYHYTGEQVATAAAYGRQMRERFTFELSGLSEAQREIVETAITDGVYNVGPNETPPDAFVALVDLFRGNEQVRGLDEDGEGDLSGNYLVRYQGEVYWTWLSVRREVFQTTDK